ncbi:hypothetical protein DSECCO2_584650 [anaerobic digester metagenome]
MLPESTTAPDPTRASAVLMSTPTARARAPENVPADSAVVSLFSVEALALTVGAAFSTLSTSTSPRARTSPFFPSPSALPSPMRAEVDWMPTATARDPARSTLALKSVGSSGPDFTFFFMLLENLVHRSLPRMVKGDIRDALTSSRTSPLELEPVPERAEVPLAEDGRMKSFFCGRESWLMVAATVTSSPTSAVPSSQALVLPTSTVTARATPAMPSLPVRDEAWVSTRSVLSART